MVIDLLAILPAESNGGESHEYTEHKEAEADMSADPSRQLDLAETIRAIRRDLTDAMKEGRSEDVRFRLGPVELELLLQVSADAGADAGVRVWVVSLGGKYEQSSEMTHRVKLVLQPIDAEGHDVAIYGTTGGKRVA